MLIQPFSDIHNYDLSFMPEKTIADILICAGDFDMGLNAQKWANGVVDVHDKKMLITPGNHDYWNTSRANFTVDEWIEKYRSFNNDKVLFLERETIVIDNVAFIMATGWTDFNNQDLITMMDSKAISKDFVKIHNKDCAISPQDIYERHLQAREFIIQELEKHSDKKCVVVTHYPPSISCNNSFKITNVSYYWCGQMEDIIRRYQPALWISGHMHNFFDQMFGDTRVILNPAGKIINGVSQLETFKNDFVVEVK